MHKSAWIGAVFIVLVGAGSARAQNALPAGWMQTDVGAVGVPGTATTDQYGDLQIAGSGNDIWGTRDSFHFVYQTIGDGAIWMSSPSLENTDPHAKIGVMFRRSSGDGSAFVMLDMQPDGSVEFMSRATTYGETQYIGGRPAGAHPWQLRLSRQDNVVSATVCGTSSCDYVGSVTWAQDDFVFAGAVITSHDNSVLNHGTSAPMPYLFKVPNPWETFDINFQQAGHIGDTWFRHNTFTVTGYGTDIWGTSDSYRFVNQTMAGDGAIVARVTSEKADNTYAKAGVIAVNDGKTVVLDIRPNGVIEFMARSTTGGSMQYLAGGASQFPVWLRLERAGNQFTGFMSTDGSQWQFIGSTNVPMITSISVGLAVTSHDPTKYNLSTFDHVALAGLRAAGDLDIGDVGAAGSCCDDSASPGRYFQWGAGADIWGTQDAFNFNYRTIAGDMTTQALVLGMGGSGGQSADAFAKAGVMIRESTDPAGAHVILDVRPGGQIEFMIRASTGAPTQFIAGGTATFPVNLRLVRTGSTITAQMSEDATPTPSWTTIGTVSVTFNGNTLAGTVVNSHQRGTLAFGYFQ
jgi:regulation of enolase protein 1 (concanavalin A-like superfamily)